VAGRSSPTLRRRELGRLLRQLREDQGLTIDEVAAQLMCSTSKVSRLETGLAGATPRDIRDLCALYEVTDEAERQQLMTLAREARQPGWWEKYDLSSAPYVSLETEAAWVSTYSLPVVPALLQTEGYARAILEVEKPPLDPMAIEQRIEARLRRQKLLTIDDGLFARCIVDEAALRRPIGGSVTMRDQVVRFIEAAKPTKLISQIISFDVGPYSGLGNSFTVLQFASPAVNDVVCVERVLAKNYLESSTDLGRRRRVFRRRQSVALAPEDSAVMVEKIAATYWDRYSLTRGF